LTQGAQQGRSDVLGLIILLATAAISFACGYGTRKWISLRRRTEYRKYAPYLAPPSFQQVPEFLLRRTMNPSGGQSHP
jgi:hypothetical protein